MKDERYKNLDHELVEIIERENMEKFPKITLDNIVGLEFLKK